MKLCIWLATLILAITQRGAAKRIDAAHQINLADVNLGDLIEKVLPSLDISKPLYELGKIVNRGGQAVSPGLAKAGKFSTSAGIALINIGTLLNASSQVLSKEGSIGGNPNFLNEAVAKMLLRRSPHNGSLRELALKLNQNQGLRTYEKQVVMEPHRQKPIRKTIRSLKRHPSATQQDQVYLPLVKKPIGTEAGSSE